MSGRYFASTGAHTSSPHRWHVRAHRASGLSAEVPGTRSKTRAQAEALAKELNEKEESE